MKQLLPYLKNKYILTFLFFLVYVLFLDGNHDLFSQLKNEKRRLDLKAETERLQHEIDETQKALDALTSDDENLERFAREEYRMKKKDEVIFVLVPKEEED